MQTGDRHLSRIRTTCGNGLKSLIRLMSRKPFHSITLSHSESQESNLEQIFESVLMDFRITLRRYEIEILYTPLAIVPCSEEKARQFFRTAIGRVVQFARDYPPVVTVEGQAGKEGYDVVFTASRSKSEKLLVIGRFPAAAESAVAAV